MGNQEISRAKAKKKKIIKKNGPFDFNARKQFQRHKIQCHTPNCLADQQNFGMSYFCFCLLDPGFRPHSLVLLEFESMKTLRLRLDSRISQMLLYDTLSLNIVLCFLNIYLSFPFVGTDRFPFPFTSHIISFQKLYKLLT